MENPTVPDAPAGAGENWAFYYYRDHFFDNFDFDNDDLPAYINSICLSEDNPHRTNRLCSCLEEEVVEGDDEEDEEEEEEHATEGAEAAEPAAASQSPTEQTPSKHKEPPTVDTEKQVLHIVM